MLDEAEKRALKIIKSSNNNLDNEKQLELAEAIGIGAIKYMDLSQNPQSLVTFTWDKALSPEIQLHIYNMLVKISSVCDKYNEIYDSKNLKNIK